jgi:hypothetical protein
MEAGELGALDWTEERSLTLAQQAFQDLDRGVVGAAKVVLVPER